MYPKYKFSQRVVDKAKDITDKKNKLFNYNNLEQDFTTRYIGLLGELAFKEWLDNQNIKYTWHNKADQKDEFDFTIPDSLDLNIDVKTVGQNITTPPPKHYACNVDAKQLKKIASNETNLFLFARYIIPTRTVYLLGWVTVKEFNKLATAHKKGEVLNKMIAPNDFYDIEISKLHPLKQL